MLIFYCRRRAVAVFFCLALLLAAIWLLKPLLPAALTVSGAPKRLVPVYKVDTEQQALSISFDASWGAEYTDDILNTLDEYGVKATFFLVNIWLNDYPEMAQEIAARGHEIGLHSTTHPHFSELTEQQMAEEITANAQLVRETIGCECALFRPPFGDYDNQVMSTVEGLGYTVIQWSVDSLDWKNLSAAEISSRVLKNIGPGDIVLFHNNGLHTAEALPGILAAFAEKGLQVIPISQLLLQGDCYTDANGVQRKMINN